MIGITGVHNLYYLPYFLGNDNDQRKVNCRNMDKVKAAGVFTAAVGTK